MYYYNSKLRLFGFTNYRHLGPGASSPSEPAGRVRGTAGTNLDSRREISGFYAVPPAGLDGTHMLSKSDHFVSTERHVCSKTSCLAVGALVLSIRFEKTTLHY